jgi:Fe-S cluster assembly protein SufD
MTLIDTLKSTLAEDTSANAKLFLDNGIPTPKIEKWHYTNLNNIMRTTWPFQKASHASQQSCGESDIRFFDGHATVCSVPDGVTILAEREASAHPILQSMRTHEFSKRDESLAALSHSQSTPLFILVDKKVEATLVLENFSMLKESVNFPHLCIAVTEGASLTLSSHSHSAGEAWSNILTQIHIANDASLTLMNLQNERKDTAHTSHTFIQAEEGSALNIYGMNIGGSLGRQTIDIDLNGKNIQTNIAAANLADGKQTQDFTIHMNHNHPSCDTNVFSRNVCRGRGQSVFQGKFYVAQQAQQTDAEMSCKSLLLSDRARADSKPELEIYADDVKCGHGATVGTLDNESLFYLMARGVPRKEAENLLVEGFIEDMLTRIPDDATAKIWRAHFAAWLAATYEG